MSVAEASLALARASAAQLLQRCLRRLISAPVWPSCIGHVRLLPVPTVVRARPRRTCRRRPPLAPTSTDRRPSFRGPARASSPQTRMLLPTGRLTARGPRHGLGRGRRRTAGGQEAWEPSPLRAPSCCRGGRRPTDRRVASAATTRSRAVKPEPPTARGSLASPGPSCLATGVARRTGQDRSSARAAIAVLRAEPTKSCFQGSGSGQRRRAAASEKEGRRRAARAAAAPNKPSGDRATPSLGAAHDAARRSPSLPPTPQRARASQAALLPLPIIHPSLALLPPSQS